MGEIDERYENGLIYTIKTDTGLYVGSTINFKARCSTHKNYIECGKIRLLYDNIRANNNEYKIEILHMFPCDNLTQLRIEERRVADELNANLNANRPYVTNEDRHTDSHKLAMLRKIDGNMLDFLCKPTENVVITKTNNSHTTPYPSDEEDE